MSDPLDGLVVLVVDDEANIRKALRQTLDRTGATPVLARDAEEAIAHISEHAVDLILLDLRLPGIDGLETLSILQRDHPDVPVVAFSAHASPEVAAEAVKRGAVDFLEKPFAPEQVRAVVRRAASSSPSYPASGATDASAALAESGPASPWPVVVSLTDPKTAPDLLRIGASMAKEFDHSEIVALCAIEVPMQISLQQAAELEDGPRRWRDAVMQVADETAPDLGVDVQHKTLWTHGASEAVREFMEEKDAAHLVMEWEPEKPEEAEKLTPADVKAIARHTESEVSLVKFGRGEFDPRKVVALADDRPEAIWAARRAWSMVRQVGLAELTVLHARSPSDESPAADERAGRRLVERVLRDATIPPEKAQVRVLVDREPHAAVVRALQEFDTAYVGASSRSGLARHLFGSLLDKVDDYFEGTVVVVQGPTYDTRTIIDELVEHVT